MHSRGGAPLNSSHSDPPACHDRSIAEIGHRINLNLSPRVGSGLDWATPWPPAARERCCVPRRLDYDLPMKDREDVASGRTIESMGSVKSLAMSTDRLDVAAATLDHLRAELDGPECLAALLRADVEAGWPPGEYDRGAQESFRDCLQEGGADAVGWYTWYAVRRGIAPQRAVVVGAAGFLGPPSEEGDAEVGFSIMPSWRGQGYATELVTALLTWAFADPRVRRIVAHTTSQNRASCRVLAKCGFRCTRHVEAESEAVRFERLALPPFAGLPHA